MNKQINIYKDYIHQLAAEPVRFVGNFEWHERAGSKGESQRTTELQPLEPFERHPTDRSSNCLEDDEKAGMHRHTKQT